MTVLAHGRPIPISEAAAHKVRIAADMIAHDMPHLARRLRMLADEIAPDVPQPPCDTEGAA